MIFDRFFKPSFQSPDPKKRIQSTLTLDPSSPNDKQKLHELAFNDVDATVSLAALERLDSFALWLKMSQIAVDKRIQKTAENNVIALLSGPSSSALSDAERRLCIIESSIPAVIRLGLENANSYEWSTDEIVSLLVRLDDAVFQRQYMLRTESPELQLILVQQIDELPTLQKLQKKTLHEITVRWLEGRVEALLALAERPDSLQRQIILLLSKMKALADSSDYVKIVDQKQTLASQIKPMNDELASFNPELSQSNDSKLDIIEQRLAVIIQQLKPAFEEQQRKQEQELQTANWLSEADTTIREASKSAQHALSATELPDLSQYIERLKSLVEQHATLASGEEALVKAKLVVVRRTLEMLNQVPELMIIGSQIYTAIDQFKNTYSLPDNYQDLDQARHIFNAMDQQISGLLKQAKGQLPSEFLKPWNALKGEWLQTLSGLKKQADQQLSSADKKISTVNSMIRQGRFKPAIAVFSKIKRSYEELPVSLQTRIERNYQNTLGRIAELEDWQHYIAQPRKPEVLAEVIALAEQSGEIDISQRRKDVDRLRKTWTSFGRLDTPDDDALNVQFDDAIEQAFVPCRQFFAQQQLERESNAESAQQVLVELKACNHDDDVIFLKAYVQLVKKWSNLGQIESATWQTLKQQFIEINKPLKQRQANIQKANVSAKQRLIERAKEAAESLMPDSADTVKQLQSQWKTIGFAGKAKDNQLWHSFKTANDQVFEKIRAGRAELKQIAKEVFEQLQNQFEALDSQLMKAENIEQFRELNAAIEALRQELNGRYQKRELDKTMLDRLTRKHQQMSSKIAESIEHINNAQANQKVDEAFDYLYSRVGEPVLLGEDAPKLLHTALTSKSAVDSSRLAVTIRFELLAGAESLEKDSDLRKQIQLNMMAKKMQSGELDSVQSLFSEWLSLGPIDKNDKVLIDRLANAYRLAERVSASKG